MVNLIPIKAIRRPETCEPQFFTNIERAWRKPSNSKISWTSYDEGERTEEEAAELN